ncbi:MAG: hypothetical protein LBC76_07500 [Treponema sp.]|nr:hypothetical protein [Treponema sp.]
MARPKNDSGIRAKVRTRDGIQTINFVECHGCWIITPEYDRQKAIA